MFIRIMIIFSTVILISQIIAGKETNAETRRGFSLDINGFYSFSHDYRNGSTGTWYTPPHPLHEYGLGLGTHYQFLTNHSIGIWSNVGIGGISMVLISHICLGAEYLYGNKVDGFAAGPFLSFELGYPGKTIGATLFYKNVFIRPGFSTSAYDERGNRKQGGHLNVGYSFYFGK